MLTNYLGHPVEVAGWHYHQYIWLVSCRLQNWRWILHSQSSSRQTAICVALLSQRNGKHDALYILKLSLGFDIHISVEWKAQYAIPKLSLGFDIHISVEWKAQYAIPKLSLGFDIHISVEWKAQYAIPKLSLGFDIHISVEWKTWYTIPKLNLSFDIHTLIYFVQCFSDLLQSISYCVW